MGLGARQPLVAALAVASLGAATAGNAGSETRTAALTNHGSTSHDGVYAVEIVTLRGACDHAYHWTISVESGRVSSPADGFMQASGQIDAGGAVNLAFRRDEQVANVAGRLQGRVGSGTWSSATLQCGGSWSAALAGSASR